MKAYKPGITCRIVDHPLWTHPLKHQIIGLAVVLIYRVKGDPLRCPKGCYHVGWKVSGLPAAYIAARTRQRPGFQGCISESILEPLPPVGLEDETETNIGCTRYTEISGT